MSNLSDLNDQLHALVSDIRSSIDALDRTGRFGEDVVVTLTLWDDSERRYECFARYGYTEKLRQLVAFHRDHNRVLLAKALSRPERAAKLMDKRVRYVRVHLRGRAWGTEMAVMEQPKWEG